MTPWDLPEPQEEEETDMGFPATLEVNHLSNHYGAELALWAAVLWSCVETLENPYLLAHMTYNGAADGKHRMASKYHQECRDWICSDVAASLMELLGIDAKAALRSLNDRGLLQWPRGGR